MAVAQARPSGRRLWLGFLVVLGRLGHLAALDQRIHERTPLVEPSLLRRRPYVAGLAVVLGFIGAMGGMMIALNVMFQTGLGLTPLACAVATVAIPVMAIGGSITSSALLAKIGRTTMHVGIVVMAVGLVIVDLVLRSDSGGVTAGDLAGPLAITGFGMSMVFVPMFDVILAGVAPHELGWVSPGPFTTPRAKARTAATRTCSTGPRARTSATFP